MIFRIFGNVFVAPTGDIAGVARCHLQGLGMRYDKIEQTEGVFRKRFLVVMKNVVTKNRKSKNLNKKSKIENFEKNIYFFDHFFLEDFQKFDLFKTFFFEIQNISYLMPDPRKASHNSLCATHGKRPPQQSGRHQRDNDSGRRFN